MDRLDRPRQALAAALAALAGYVDAAGFLSADRYFVSFMSGNTTRLAAELVVDGAKAAIPALLIIGFVFGVALGHIVGHRAGRWRKPAVLGLVTALLTLACFCAAAGVVAAMMALLVLAMGALNTALQQDETPIALTYLTGALVRVGLGLGGLVTGRRQAGLGAYVVLWLALAVGAALGATSFVAVGPECLAAAAAGAAVLTEIARRLALSRS